MSEVVRLPTLLTVLTQAYAAQSEAERVAAAMAHLLPPDMCSDKPQLEPDEAD